MYGHFEMAQQSQWWYGSFGPRIILQFDLDSENQWRWETLYEALSEQDSKIYKSELVYRHNFKNNFALDAGVEVDETFQKIYISAYYFTF